MMLSNEYQFLINYNVPSIVLDQSTSNMLKNIKYLTSYCKITSMEATSVI